MSIDEYIFLENNAAIVYSVYTDNKIVFLVLCINSIHVCMLQSLYDNNPANADNANNKTLKFFAS